VSTLELKRDPACRFVIILFLELKVQIPAWGICSYLAQLQGQDVDGRQHAEFKAGRQKSRLTTFVFLITDCSKTRLRRNGYG